MKVACVVAGGTYGHGLTDRMEIKKGFKACELTQRSNLPRSGRNNGYSARPEATRPQGLAGYVE